MTSTAIGIHVHAEPDRLRETLAALAANTPDGYQLLLLPDGPDTATAEALATLTHIAQSPTAAAQGAAACFNRLARETTADILVLLESGSIVAPYWLDKLRAALSDPRHGLATPSTNRSWNQLAVLPRATPDRLGLARATTELQNRFRGAIRPLAPLWDVGDFCLAAKRAVFDAIGPADEAYSQGPCWEMDYAIRAVRAGHLAVWAQAAFVFRHPFTARREQEESRRFDASRRRYQDKFCGQLLSGARTTYAAHCRGEDCTHFAPQASSPRPPRTQSPAVSPAASPAVSPSPGTPLVSCIMPTSGRPDWVPQAIRYFQQQDVENTELIIVDTGPPGLESLLPNDPRIHHHRLAGRRSIGAMRNIACDLARGDIVMQWDDDDWYGPRRVSTQIRPILDGSADITGLTDTLFFDLDRWSFWRCTPVLHRRMFHQDVHGGTLTFRRTLFGPCCRYPDRSLAEDAAFLNDAIRQGARLHRIPAEDHFIYLRHGRNAWTFPCGVYLDASGWRREEEPHHLRPSRAFYTARSPAAPRRLTPLASCIMPTANRRRFIPGAIARFLGQNYETRELIILDDGTEPVADLIPAHPQIRYLRTARHPSLGAKRNAACQQANGDIILHWDDDDWYAPDRITRQVDALQDSGAAITGLDRAYLFDARRATAWEYVYPAGGPPWVYGATLCYRTEYWRAHNFPDITIGEDTRFAALAKPGELHVMPDNRFFVGLVHAGNTSPKHTRDPRWRSVDIATIRALTGDWPVPESAPRPTQTAG
jgi:O-antigen biosynthesis protein